jgi:ferritin-like metal-binding protein YciE
MKIKTMDDLFLAQIKDLYDAEKQLVKALPKMAKAASSQELRQGFQEHLEQTKGHVSRLEQIFDQLGEKASGTKCEGMAGLINEGEEIVDEIEQSPLRDAGLIGAAQRVEHYEIAAYGTVKTFARMLGRSQAVTLLEQTLNEEKQTDQKLTQLAESMINEEAIQVGSSGGSAA